LSGPDHVDVAHRLVVGGGTAFARITGVGRQHAVELRDLERRIADHRVVRGDALRLTDVLGPLRVVRDRVDREADDLRVALVELALDARHVAELGGADRREVLGMREEHGPPVTDPLVELDRALG